MLDLCPIQAGQSCLRGFSYLYSMQCRRWLFHQHILLIKYYVGVCHVNRQNKRGHIILVARCSRFCAVLNLIDVKSCMEVFTFALATWDLLQYH